MRLPKLRRPGAHKRATKSTDATMPLMDHLFELRRRLFIAVLGVLAGTIVGFIWSSFPPMLSPAKCRNRRSNPHDQVPSGAIAIDDPADRPAAGVPAPFDHEGT